MSAPRTRQHAAPQSPPGRPACLGDRTRCRSRGGSVTACRASRVGVVPSPRGDLPGSTAPPVSEVGANRVCIANRLAPGTLHLGVPRRHRDLSRVAPGAVIRLAFDRPIDGVATAAAPAACVAVTPPAFEAVHRRPASTDVLPPPDFSLCSRPSPFPGSQSPRTTLCGGLRTSGPHAEQPSTMQRPVAVRAAPLSADTSAG